MDWVELYRRLSANAFLFDDPSAYSSGIADALDAVRRILEWEGLVATVPDGADLSLSEPADLSLTAASDRTDRSLAATTVLALPD